MKLASITLILLVSPILGADHNDDLLKQAAESIRLIWTEWMHNPKLEYDRIKPEQLEALFGEWRGDYILREEPKERARLTLTIRRDGSWTSDHWDPTDNARWYVGDGMILLFQKPLNDPDTDLDTAVVMKDGTLHLLNYQAKGGLIRLKKIKKAEPAGAGQPATKPADKVPSKGQPSTPTPKVGPR